MRRAQPDGGFEIAAHAHRHLLQPVARGDLGQQREMRRRFVLERRDAHQPDHVEAQRPALGDEGVGLHGRHAGLLLLLAGIDLHEDRQTPALLRHLLRQRLGQLGPVDALNDVEQRHRFLRLVGLQRADQVQFEIRPYRLQRRELALRLLHAVLAEHALAGPQQRLDLVRAMGLGHRHQGHRRRLVAPRRAAGGGDALADGGESAGGVENEAHAARHKAIRRPTESAGLRTKRNGPPKRPVPDREVQFRWLRT